MTKPSHETVLMNSSAFIPVAEPDLGPAEEAAVLDAMRSGWVSSIGTYLTQFEASFASFCGTRHAACVSNGTTAIHLLLIAAGIGPGDEVIVPSLTFVATAAAVIHSGATPVFVDCDPMVGILDIHAVAAAISPKTKAVIAVHLYGHPAQMQALQDLAKKHGLYLFEDAAEAHGAKYKEKTVGACGHAATFSFYGNKVITTGEGGMIVTDDETLITRVRFLRDHAMDPKRRYWHPEIGYNYRMTNLQAALGTAQLKRFDEITDKRQRVLDLYRSSGISEQFGIKFNPREEWASPIPWLVCAVFPKETASFLPMICSALKESGVDSRPYFHPLHEMPPYINFRRVAADGGHNLIQSVTLSSRGINLPSSGGLTENDIYFITTTLISAIEKTCCH